MELILKNKEKICIVLSICIIACTIVYYIIQNNKKNECNHSNIYIVGGEAVGIKLLATGVLVMGIDREDTALEIGDIILEVNGCKIETNAELQEYASLGEKLTLKVNRKEKILDIDIIPKISSNTNEYKLGLWVKDSSAGVGTITFYEKETGNFAALGHAITETKNLAILPITSGGITQTEIYSIKKGIPKVPGELKGTLTNITLGEIYTNTQNGVFGHILDKEMYKKNDEIEIGTKDKIEIGKAYIIITLENNEKKKYEVQIEKIYFNSTDNKNIALHVTDKELLEKTGGIVQGMSGAPIIQNNKLIGSLTHVLLDDATRGYGVFVESMIEDMNCI